MLQEWARFELVVAADGSVHAPVVLVQGRSKATLEALETFRTLEMGPAKVDGEPVAVYWRPRPKVWVIHGGNDPIESALAPCTDLGAVMETSGVGTGPYSPFLSPEPGLIETLRKRAMHRDADTLVVTSYDDLNIKGRIFRCGPDWVPPRLRAGEMSKPRAKKALGRETDPDTGG